MYLLLIIKFDSNFISDSNSGANPNSNNLKLVVRPLEFTLAILLVYHLNYPS